MIHTEQPQLFQLVQGIVRKFSSGADLRSNSILNHIPDDMALKADVSAIKTVLEGMINSVMTNAKESCIRISAKIYHDVILVHIKDSTSNNNYAVSAGLTRVQPLAEQVGGYVNITSQRQLETTIAFSFMNVCGAAA